MSAPDRPADAMRVPLLSFTDVSVRVGDFRPVEHLTWEIWPGQHWAVTGPNGAGKTTLIGAVTGDLPIVAGQARRAQGIRAAVVSPDAHQRLLALEMERDHGRFFAGRPDDVATVAKILAESAPDALPGRMASLLDLAGVGHVADRPLRVISTGEMRRVLVVRALLRSPSLLALDEPFDGLDPRSRHRLMTLVDDLAAAGTCQILLVTHRETELPAAITHWLRLERGRAVRVGPRDGAPVFSRPVSAPCAHVGIAGPSGSVEIGERGGWRECAVRDGAGSSGGMGEGPSDGPPRELARLENVTVGYPGVTILSGLSWRVLEGEHWAITGPSGAGKSTLLKLLTGDHPQAYANDIHLFGRRRGTGETLADIRARVGIVSHELQMGYRKPVTALETVVSGFYDSIGLYRDVGPERERLAREWLERLGLSALANRRLERLSGGQRRMVLIARALVKSPPLLILDEPCQGLDTDNRALVLSLITRLAHRAVPTLLYVTHHEEEIVPGITRRLRFEPSPAGRGAPYGVVSSVGG